MRTRPSSARSRIVGATLGTSATLIRKGEGSRDKHGEWQPGVERSSAIRLAVRPPGGPDTWTNWQRIVEEGGLRLDGLIQVWTLTRLEAAGTGVTGDVLEIEGQRYRVRAVEAYPGHYTSLAERIEGQSET